MKRLPIEMDPERNSSPNGSHVERLVMSAAAAAAPAPAAAPAAAAPADVDVPAVTTVGVKASSSLAVVVRIITLVLTSSLCFQSRWSHSGHVYR